MQVESAQHVLCVPGSGHVSSTPVQAAREGEGRVRVFSIQYPVISKAKTDDRIPNTEYFLIAISLAQANGKIKM